MSDEKILPSITPEECVSKAMMFGFARITTDAIAAEMLRSDSDTHLSIEGVVEKATRGRCAQSSIEAIYYMATRHPELFDKYIIVRAKPIETDKFKHGHWSYHAYFIVHGKDGLFYAGAPSNFAAENHLPLDLPGKPYSYSDQTEYLNPLVKVFKASSVEDVLTQIHDEGGGSWPSALMVNEGITDKYQDPEFDMFTIKSVDDSGSSQDMVVVSGNVLEVTTDYEDELRPPANTPIHMRRSNSFRDMEPKIDPKTLPSLYERDDVEQEIITEIKSSENIHNVVNAIPTGLNTR